MLHLKMFLTRTFDSFQPALEPFPQAVVIEAAWHTAAQFHNTRYFVFVLSCDNKLDASTGMFLREAERRVQECMLKRPSMLQPFATNILWFLSIFVIQDHAQAEQGQANKQRAGHVNCMTCLYFDVRNRILHDRMEFAQRCPLFPANHYYKV